MSRRAGLPETIRMRHDSHYVEALVSSAGTPIGKLVAIDLLDPNPNQPRQVMGDLGELIASIAEKGILEPLIVRPRGGRFQIVSGERRYQAAVQVGLHELPVIVRDVDDREMLELALVENLQRKDLTPFEEAEGLRTLGQRFGYTHEEIARKIGKSRTSVTESLSLNAIPRDIKELCRLADIASKSLLLQVVKQSTPEKMAALVQRIAQQGATREDVRRETARRKPGRPKSFVFRYRPSTKAFSLQLSFRKSQVARDEIVAALRAILDELLHGQTAAH